MLITTTHGDMEESELKKREIRNECSESIVTATEYYLGDELVHRSIHAELIGRDLSSVQQPL